MLRANLAVRESRAQSFVVWRQKPLEQPSKSSSASQFCCYVRSTIPTLINGKRHHFATLKIMRFCKLCKLCKLSKLLSLSSQVSVIPGGLWEASVLQSSEQWLRSCQEIGRPLDSWTCTGSTDVSREVPQLNLGTFWLRQDLHETSWTDLARSVTRVWLHLVTRGLVKSSDGAHFSVKYATCVLFHIKLQKVPGRIYSANSSWTHSGSSVFLSAFASLFHCGHGECVKEEAFGGAAAMQTFQILFRMSDVPSIFSASYSLCTWWRRARAHVS